MKVYKAIILPTVTYRHNLKALEKFHNRSV